MFNKLKTEVLREVEENFAGVEEISEYNTAKVLDAMRKLKVSDAHFKATTGYAYGDIGREKLDELFAEIFKAAAALVRTQFVSGTHALATVLFGILRPNDELISVTGEPYDTMQTVIGWKNPARGSLKEFGVDYKEIALRDGKVDIGEYSTSILLEDALRTDSDKVSYQNINGIITKNGSNKLLAYGTKRNQEVAYKTYLSLYQFYILFMTLTLYK